MRVFYTYFKHSSPLWSFFLIACSMIYILFILLFCFNMRIYSHFTVRNHEVLLDYVRTPQYRPHGDNFT